MLGMSEMLEGVMKLEPSAPAVEDQGRWRTWGELAARIEALEVLYRQLGLGEGARVGVLLRNRFELLAALLSVIKSRRCLVTLNPVYPDATLTADIAGLKLPLVVGEAADLARTGVLDAVRALGAAAIELGGEDERPARLVDGCARIGGDVLDSYAPGIAVEMLTSGTTGKPKRVLLRRDAFEFNFQQSFAYESGFAEGDPIRLRSGVQMISAPLAHIGGVWGAVNRVAGGRKICLLEKFSVAEWTGMVKRHGLKVASAPPAALRMLLDANVAKEDLQSLQGIIAGTAPCDPALIDAFWERYGVPVLPAYGATEFSGAVAGWTRADFLKYYPAKRGAVGRLQKGVSARVVDPDSGGVLPFGQQGVLELRSKQLVDPDNWVRSTDLAVLDADDFLWIRGRVDNAIIRGGFKVHPDDVVQALQTHPAVREAAVVGIPDERLGEVPAAAIILKAGAAQPSPEALAAFLKTHLLPYQIPATLLFVDDLPRTVSLKPSLVAVRGLFAAIVR